MTIGAPAEFSLTAACAVWPPSAARSAAIREAAKAITDWDRFLRVVRRQRVEGLVHEGLTSAGVALSTPVGQALERRATAIARGNLFMSAETARLQKRLDDVGAPNLILKGTTLSYLAYKNPSVKMSWDIDILTCPDSVERAIYSLREAGYVWFSPKEIVDKQQLRIFIALARECVFSRREDRTFVELKWCLDQNPQMLKGITARSPAQDVPVGRQIILRTLHKDDLFSYLCVHGARHAFGRLKWVADIAALLAQEPLDEIERLYRVSQQKGAGRCAAQALLLCERLLGTALPPRLSAELKTDAPARWLVSVAISTMAGGDGEEELARRRLANTRIALSHLLFGRTLAVVAAELKFKWASLHDHMHTPLPGWASFLYPIMRLPLFLWRRAVNTLAETR